MKTWHLRPKDIDSWDFCSFGAVVIAQNEAGARRVAAQASEDIWLDKNLTICEEIVPDEYVVDCLVLDDVSNIPLFWLLKGKVRQFWNSIFGD